MITNRAWRSALRRWPLLRTVKDSQHPDMDETLDVSATAEPVIEAEAVSAETVADAPIVDGEPVDVGQASERDSDGSGR